MADADIPELSAAEADELLADFRASRRDHGPNKGAVRWCLPALRRWFDALNADADPDPDDLARLAVASAVCRPVRDALLYGVLCDGSAATWSLMADTIDDPGGHDLKRRVSALIGGWWAKGEPALDADRVRRACASLGRHLQIPDDHVIGFMGVAAFAMLLIGETDKAGSLAIVALWHDPTCTLAGEVMEALARGALPATAKAVRKAEGREGD